MLYTEKKYPNNYAWPGAKALMYNVELANFFNANGRLKSEFSYSLIDIGFEWKPTSSQNWTSVSLKNVEDTYISILDDVKEYDEDGEYPCIRYTITENSGIYPIRVIIKNLTPNTSYDLRSYYEVEEVKNYYNQQTISTLEFESDITFSELHITQSAIDNVDEQELEDFKNRILTAKTAVLEIYDMFYASDESEYNVSIDYSNGNWAATGGGGSVTFNARFRSETTEQIRSVFIHELAHCDMRIDNNRPSDTYKNKIIKFMEFATNIPHAMWKWQGAHNYPVISSQRYGFLDDCLVIAACELSKEISFV